MMDTTTSKFRPLGYLCGNNLAIIYKWKKIVVFYFQFWVFHLKGFLWTLFFRGLLGVQESWGEVQSSPVLSVPPYTPLNSLPISVPQQSDTCVAAGWLTLVHPCHLMLLFPLELTPGIFHCMGLGKYIMHTSTIIFSYKVVPLLSPQKPSGHRLFIFSSSH